MPRHLLSDVAVRKAKAASKPYRLADGDNLYLRVAPSGTKSFQLRYKLEGVPQTHTIGKWPLMSLADARQEAEKKRKVAAQGEHLTTAKRVEKMKRAAERINTFEAVAADWIKREAGPRRKNWSADYKAEVEASLRNHLAPLNKLPLSKINAQVVGPVLRAIERRAPLMLEKVRRRLNGIVDYGVESGIIAGNALPVTMMRGVRLIRRHFPAVTTLPEIGDILRAARAAEACKGVRRAHELLVFTEQRVSEVVGTPWAEMDLERGVWTIPRERMKNKNPERGPHAVPLAPQLLASLREWRAADSPDARYVCPAPRDPSKSITPEAIEKHYRRALGLASKHSPHSWRSAFKTICGDAGKDADTVESQLDHVVGSKVASAYDRAKRFELRRELVAWYERTLLLSRDGATVTPIRKAI